jgi:glucose-6-phosphate isomerase
MIKVETSLAQAFLSDAEINDAQLSSKTSFSELKAKSGKGSEWLGWREILADPNDALLSEISSIADHIRRVADVFIICGIGGSYLGAKAVIDALSPFFGSDGPEIIYAGHHMSGRYLNELVAHLKMKNSDGKDKQIYLNVISKSGTTTETAIAFRVLRDLMEDMYGDAAAKRIICTTSASGGALNEIIAAKGYKKFILPDTIGGRFSVLTPVGLLPIAVAGFDIRSLFYGAVSQYRNLDSDGSSLVDYTSTRYALFKKGFAIDVIASFEPELQSLGGWMQQLLGESEGKNHKGLYPAVHAYSTDLHSLGQMVQDGQRNILETFIIVDEDESKLAMPADKDDYDGLNYLTGKMLHEINTKARLGTTKAHVDGGVPVINIYIPTVSEETVGALIYFFEVATAVYVYNLGENPFDQPGVEDYKKAMFKLLGKP